MTREEIVTALRCCASNGANFCAYCKECPADGEDCEAIVQFAAADLIENQQREIEALRQANAALRDTVLRRDAQSEKMKEGNNGTTDEEN